MRKKSKDRLHSAKVAGKWKEASFLQLRRAQYHKGRVFLKGIYRNSGHIHNNEEGD